MQPVSDSAVSEIVISHKPLVCDVLILMPAVLLGVPNTFNK